MVSPIVQMLNYDKHNGISGIPTQLLVLHSGECPLRGGYAQSLTNWANIPLSQGGPEASWQWFVDPIAIVEMVPAVYAAWHASEANPMSEGMEQAGYARYTREEWLTPEGMKQLDNLAWLFAQRCKANGIPARWLTTEEVEAVTKHGNREVKGLCLHRQIDPETRTDPGNNYPYDELLQQIRFYLGETAPAVDPTTPPAEEDKMLVIATAPEENGRIWIGDGITRRHIPDPFILDTYQKMAGWGVLKIFKNGEVQTLPADALGVDITYVTNVFTQKVVNERAGELVHEVRNNAAHQANRVLDILQTLPSVPADLVEQYKREIAAATAESVEAIKEQFSDIELTFEVSKQEPVQPATAATV